MDKYRASLLALDRELETAIASKQNHDRLTGPELAALDKQKQADNRKTQDILAQCIGSRRRSKAILPQD